MRACVSGAWHLKVFPGRLCCLQTCCASVVTTASIAFSVLDPSVLDADSWSLRTSTSWIIARVMSCAMISCRPAASSSYYCRVLLPFLLHYTLGSLNKDLVAKYSSRLGCVAIMMFAARPRPGASIKLDFTKSLPCNLYAAEASQAIFISVHKTTSNSSNIDKNSGGGGG